MTPTAPEGHLPHLRDLGEEGRGEARGRAGASQREGKARCPRGAKILFY